MELCPGKRIAKALLLCFGITFVITGVAIAVMSRGMFADWFTSKKEAYNVSDVGLGELKAGDHVTLDVKVTLGAFMKHIVSTKKGNSVTSSSATVYYLMPVLKDDADGTSIEYLIAFAMGNKSANAKGMSKLEKAFSEWWNDTTGTVARPDEVVASIDGRVANLSKKELKYLDEYYAKYLKGLDREDTIQTVVIRELWTEADKSTVKVMGIGSIITVLLGAFMIFRGFRKGKKKAVQTVQQPVQPAQQWQQPQQPVQQWQQPPQPPQQ